MPCRYTLLCVALSLFFVAPIVAADKSSPFDAQVLQIAKEYQKYGRVDDETRWAPYLCRMPNPSTARFSQSGDAKTHGEKLYFLFAKDRAAYMKLASAKPASGQVVVKEAWKPQEVAAGEKPSAVSAPATKGTSNDDGQRNTYLAYAKKEGKLYKAHEKSGLYIMFRLDMKTEGTDDGWVYGTVTADGKQVTSSGRVESCMKCHLDAPHGRLFGLPVEKK